MCNRSEYRKRLQGILDILERKVRLDTRIKSVSNKKLSDASMMMSASSGTSAAVHSMELSFICCSAQSAALADKAEANEAALKMMRYLMNLLH